MHARSLAGSPRAGPKAAARPAPSPGSRPPRPPPSARRPRHSAGACHVVCAHGNGWRSPRWMVGLSILAAGCRPPPIGRSFGDAPRAALAEAPSRSGRKGPCRPSRHEWTGAPPPRPSHRGSNSRPYDGRGRQQPANNARRRRRRSRSRGHDHDGVTCLADAGHGQPSWLSIDRSINRLIDQSPLLRPLAGLCVRGRGGGKWDANFNCCVSNRPKLASRRQPSSTSMLI